MRIMNNPHIIHFTYLIECLTGGSPIDVCNARMVRNGRIIYSIQNSLLYDQFHGAIHDGALYT